MGETEGDWRDLKTGGDWGRLPETGRDCWRLERDWGRLGETGGDSWRLEETA